jgi:hypothetical protein
MAVAMVIGNNNRISPSPFSPAQTMSSVLASNCRGSRANASLSAGRGGCDPAGDVLAFNVVADTWWWGD